MRGGERRSNPGNEGSPAFPLDRVASLAMTTTAPSKRHALAALSRAAVTPNHLVLRRREATSKDASGAANEATNWTILRDAKLRFSPQDEAAGLARSRSPTLGVARGSLLSRALDPAGPKPGAPIHSLPATARLNGDRHCERSEAIQGNVGCPATPGSPRRFAPRDDDCLTRA